MDKSRSLLPSFRLVAVTVAIASVAAAMTSLSHPAALSVDGQRIVSDVPPVTSPKGEAFVPLRAVAETLGAEMNYDQKTGEIELVRANDTLRMRVGERVATLNGNKLTMKHPPFAVRGRTMVSLGVVARAFGTRVRYDRAHAHIDVLTPGIVEAGAQQDAP